MKANDFCQRFFLGLFLGASTSNICRCNMLVFNYFSPRIGHRLDEICERRSRSARRKNNQRPMDFAFFASLLVRTDFDLVIEPGASVGPAALGGWGRDTSIGVGRAC